MVGTGRFWTGARTAFAPPYGPFIGLVLLLLANAGFTSGFATSANFRNILLQATPTLLVATGMTLVIATGGIDLSVGSTMALASAAAALNLGHGAAVAIGIGMATGALVGLLNGVVTAIGRVPRSS